MEAIPTPRDCCQTCDEVVTVAVPGPQGPAGADGADGAPGADGINAWTTTTADFVMPAEAATVVVSVEENRWMFEGQIVQVEGAGWFEVAAVPGGSTTSVTLRNIEDSTTGEYPDNVAPGTTVVSGAKVSPSGPTAPPTTGTAPVDAQYWCSAADATLTDEVDMSAIGNGYVKVAAGTPSAVAEIPDEDVEYDELTLTGTSPTLDWDAGYRVFYLKLTGNTTVTFDNEVTGKQILVIIEQDSATAYSCTFTPSSGTVKWSGGVAPDLTAVSTGSYNVFSFVCCKATGAVIGTSLTDAY